MARFWGGGNMPENRKLADRIDFARAPRAKARWVNPVVRSLDAAILAETCCNNGSTDAALYS
jgi:hypothetical protein